MAITNCSISPANVTFTNDGGDPIGNDIAILYIIPATGYTVRKENFVNNTGSQTWLQAIQMENTDQANLDIYYSGSPYATAANQVKITITLNPSYVMPSANTTLQVDIDDYGEYGGGQLEQTDICLDDIHTVDSGNHTVTTAVFSSLTTSAATASGKTTTTISGNLAIGNTSVIITKTLEAATGKCYQFLPYVVANLGGFLSRFDFSDYTVTYNSYNQITKVVYSVKYTTIDGDPGIPCSDGLSIEWIHKIQSIYEESGTNQHGSGTTKYIKYLNINTSDLPAKGAIRDLQVIGSPGAIFTLVIDQEDNHTYNFTTNAFTASSTSLANQTLGSSGIYTKAITFPPVTDNDNYDVTITAGTSTALAATVPSSTVTYDINQYALSVMTLATASASHSAKYTDDTLSAVAFTMDSTFALTTTETSGKLDYAFSFVFTRSGSYTFGSLTRQPVFGDFTNTSADDNGGTYWTVLRFLAVRDSSTQVTVTGTARMQTMGTSSFTATLALDNFIAIS